MLGLAREEVMLSWPLASCSELCDKRAVLMQSVCCEQAEDPSSLRKSC